MPNTLIHIIFILALFMQVTSWSRHSSMRTGQTTMYNNAIGFTSSTTPISYNVSYSSVLQSTPKSAAVSFLNCHTGISTSLSVNSTIQLFTTSSLRMTFRVYSDTLVYFYGVNWIVLGNSPDFAEVLLQCTLCTVLNTGRGSRNESKTAQSMFIGGPNVFIVSFLSCFVMNNGDGLTNYLEIKATLPTAKKTINYSFFTDENNTVTSLCYATAIYNQDIGLKQYYNYGRVGQAVFQNQLTPSPSFNLASTPASYRSTDCMFYGISAFKLSRAVNRLFGIDTTNHGDLGSMTAAKYNHNVGTYQVKVNYFYISVRGCNTTVFQWYFVSSRTDGTCRNHSSQGDGIGACASQTDYYPSNPTLGGGRANYCSPCSMNCPTCIGALSTECISCRATDFRQLSANPSGSCNCFAGYVDIGIMPCYPCSTFIPGCQTCSNVLICSNCSTGYTRTSVGLCQCTIGHLVSGVCTNITGCIQLQMFTGISYCTQCNTTTKFQLTSNSSCECSTGYYISNTDICLPKCGDGKQTDQENCDDGNILSGDGCSVSCQIEDGWICFGGNLTSVSECLISADFVLKVKYIRRITNENKMSMAVAISPVFEQLSKLNLKTLITQNVTTLFDVSYSNGIIYFDFPYTQTIQANIFTITLNINNSVFVLQNTSTTFVAQAMNAQLTYDSYNQVNFPLQIIVIIIASLGLLLAFVSTVSEKMIGIQTIQTMQIILFTQTVMKTTPSSFTPLQMLRYASGWNSIQGIDHSRTYTFSNVLSSVGLEKQFLLSFNLMYVLLLAVIVICLLLKGRQLLNGHHLNKNLSEINHIKAEQKYEVSTKIFNFCFERIFFVTVFISMFLIVFGLMLQMTDQSSDYILLPKQFNLLAAIISNAILITVICGVVLNGCFPNILLFPMLMKQAYPPIYFIYQTAFIFLLAFDYTQSYVLFILEGMSFLFILFLIFYRPYPEKFDTFVLIFHQLVIMGTMGIYIFQNITSEEHEILYKIVNGVIIFAMLIMLALNSYRVYAYYQFLAKNGWNQYGFSKDYFDEQFDYTRIASPSNPRPPIVKYTKNSSHKKTQKEINDSMEMQTIRTRKVKKNEKNKDQGDSNINWITNELANEQSYGPNAAMRVSNLETNIDYGKKKEENKKNKSQKENNGNDIVHEIQESADNPTETKQLGKLSNSKESNEDDFLQAQKRRLKTDFTSKIKEPGQR